MRRLGIIILLTFVLSGCGITTPFKFPSSPKNAPQRAFTHQEKETITPKILVVEHPVTGEKFKVHVGEEIIREYSVGLSEDRPKVTWIQKLMGLGWKLLAIVILFTVLGIIFPPIAMINGLVGRGLGMGAQRIVAVVDKALDRMDNKEEKAKFLKNLSENMSLKDKELVQKLKKKIRGTSG